MNIQLYNNSSENNVIGKNKTLVTIIDCVIKDISARKTPTIIISSSTDLSNVNYFFISEWDRYYFIDNVKVMPGNRVEITGHVDVLDSFRDEILNLSCIISKQQDSSMANLDYDDGSFVTLNKNFNKIINFTQGFNEEPEYILLTAGAF